MTEVTLDNFVKNESGEIRFNSPLPNITTSLVYVSAPWCGPCKMISPIIEKVAVSMQENLLVRKMNADDQTLGDILKDLSIRNIPTILIFNEGKLVERSVGMKSETEIMSMLEPYTTTTKTTE